MNIKIKAENVFELFDRRNSKISYDQIYLILKQQLDDEDFIFTKRTPGAGFLQWDLPGEGWTPLCKADPLVAMEVTNEKERRFRRIMDILSSQQLLAQKVLTIPDDSYIFYRPTADGRVEIKITAWGYKYPEKMDGGGFSGKLPPKVETQEVVLTFIYDGKSLPTYDFHINGFARKTGADGSIVLGLLPIGTTYDIETSTGHKMPLTVTTGQREYRIDVTDYVTVIVIVKKEGSPAPNVTCQLNYWGHSATITTEASGSATTTMPLDIAVSDCVVTVDGECQQRPLMVPKTVFEFDLKTPESQKPEQPKEPEIPEPIISPKPPTEPETPTEPTVPEEPIEEPKDPEPPVSPDEPKPEEPEPKEPEPPISPAPRKFCPIIRIEGKDGFVGRRYPIRVTIGNVSQDYVSDDTGEVHLPEYSESQQMLVQDLLLADNKETYTLSANQKVYIFHVPYRPVNGSADIKIIVEDEDGHRMNGATIFFEQKGHPDTIGYLGEEGTVYLSYGDYATDVPLNVVLTVKNEKWKPITFELVEGENEYLLRAIRKTSTRDRLLEILAAIGGFAGTFMIYYVVMLLLFG